MRPRRPAAILAAASLLLFGACKEKPPGPGDPCKKTDILCLDPRTELACQRGVFVAAPCKGPLGCREDGKHLQCDFSGNQDGDPCSTDDEGNARCTADGRRITCTGGHYEIDTCRGDEGCRSTGSELRCDRSKAEEGDGCKGTTNACSLDGKRVLACSQGKFRTSAPCPGEGGCAFADHEIHCDLGKKEEGKDRKGAKTGG